MASHPDIPNSWNYIRSPNERTYWEQWTQHDPNQTEAARRVIQLYQYCYRFTVNGKKRPTKRYQSEYLRDRRLWFDPLRKLIPREEKQQEKAAATEA